MLTAPSSCVASADSDCITNKLIDPSPDVYCRRLPVRPGLNRERSSLGPRALLLWRRDYNAGTTLTFSFIHLHPKSPAAGSPVQAKIYRQRACSHSLGRSLQLAQVQPSRTQTHTQTTWKSHQHTGINPMLK